MEIGHVAAKDPVQPTSMNRVLKVNRKTPAAQWNRRMLKTLSPALEKDPEADLLSVLPNFYSKTLAGLREGTTEPKLPKKTYQPELPRPELPRRDTRSLLQESDSAIIVSALSDDVKKLLTGDDDLPRASFSVGARSSSNIPMGSLQWSYELAKLSPSRLPEMLIISPSIPPCSISGIRSPVYQPPDHLA